MSRANEYSDRGQRTRSTDPTGGVTTWTYDGAGRMVSTVEPRGNVAGGNPALFRTTYEYDGAGRRTKITDPTGRITTTSYDQVGRTNSINDPQGVTSYGYDAAGNELSQTRTGIGTTSRMFDSLNRVQNLTDPRGKTTTMAYDLAGNLITSTSPLGLITRYTYDLAGRRVTMIDPRGNVSGANPVTFTTTYGYDAAGNRITVTNPLGQMTATTFNRTGQVASVTDPKSNITSYTYDPVDRVKTVTAPLQGTTTYNYNTTGRLTTQVDSKIHTTSYLYDLSGRVVRRTDPLSRYWTYAYDVSGNLIDTVNALANAAANPSLGRTSTTYDTVGRPTFRDYSTSTTPDVSYSYDGVGRLASMSDGAGTQTYGYDAAGRLTNVTRGTQTHTYSYDAAGNVLTRSLPTGSTITYGYDDDNRLTTVTDGAAVTVYGYDANSNPTTMALPNTVTRTVAYDAASRPTTITSTRTGNPVAAYAYTRDANGQATQIVGTGTAVALTRQFSYDAANRLATVCYQAGNCNNNQRTTWTYDSVGNRLSEKIANASTSTYTYDNADQLTAITGPGAATFTYDPNGNQLTAGPRTSGYNTALQTISIQDGTNPATTYTYDGDGNRRTTTTAASTLTASWDINNPLALLSIETDQTGTQLRRYTYGLEPLSMTTPAGTDYYLTDELGSITHTLDTAGATRWAYTYQPSGTTNTATKIDPNAPDNPVRFTGQYNDPTGRYNLRARSYNPAHARFTQTDPTPRGAGSAFESAYVYGNNNPAVHVDPSGMRGGLPRSFNPIRRLNFGRSSIGVGGSSVFGPSAFGGPVVLPGGDGIIIVPRALQPKPRPGGTKTKVAIGVGGAIAAACGSGQVDCFPKNPPRTQSGGRGGITTTVPSVGSCDPPNYPSGKRFFRGALPGELVSFVPRVGVDIRVGADGFVGAGRGLPLESDPTQLQGGRTDAYEVDLSSIPCELQIRQKGSRPSHHEIMVNDGVEMSAGEFADLANQIGVL